MVRKLFICLLLLFSFNSVVFAGEYVMTEELAEEILDYYRQGSNYWAGNSSYISAYGSTVQNILNTLTAENFATYFNTYMEETTFEKTGTFKNLTVLFEVIYPGKARFSFFQSNNTSPGGLELPYINILQLSSNISTSYTINGTDSLIDSTSKNLNFLNLVFSSNGTLEPSSGDSTFNRNITNITFNNDDTIIYIPSLLALSKAQFLYYTPYSGQKNGYFIGNTVSGNYDPIPPDLPSGDNGGGTISSGDTTNEAMTIINNNIIKIHDDLVELNGKIATSGDIQAIMSGEVGKITETLTTVPSLSGETITSEQIENALNIEFMVDPYDNFWFELTTGLSHSLTDNVREIEIPWFNGYVYNFNLDTWGLKFPPAFEFILRSISTISLTWIMLKYWKIIVDKISSGSIDEVLAMNEEEGIIDLF